MSIWKTASTGIRYREHPTRKHGINPDRYYVIHYRIDGKRIEEALGWLSEGWTMNKAERTRNDLKQSAKNSGPRTLKARRSLAALEDSKAITFDAVLAELWTEELSHKKSGKDILRLMEHDALPEWKGRRIDSIKRRDIVLLLDKIKKRAPVTRNRVHSALSRLFNFAAERGVIEDSPCTRIKKTAEKPRDRVLTNEEIKLFWSAMSLNNKEIDIYRQTRLALKMILLTGQRPGEVAGMAWSEIDGDIWTIPAARTKAKEENIVPLPYSALDVLKEAAELSSESKYVFPSSQLNGDRPMTAHALSRAIVKHWEEIGFKEKFVPHDLRRTVRTRLAEVGVDDVVAERILGHKLQGIMRVYNHHGYLTEKKLALSKWDNCLKEIVGMPTGEASKIIQMERYRNA